MYVSTKFDINPLGILSRNVWKDQKVWLTVGFFCCVWPWNVIPLKNYRASLLCYFKLCASFHSHQWINSLGPQVAIWRGSARPAFLEVAIWQPPLAARIWRAPPHGNKNIGATYRNVTSNIVHSYLFTLQKSVLFLFYHPIKMKLRSVVGWNLKHWPDLTCPIFHKLT